MQLVLLGVSGDSQKRGKAEGEQRQDSMALVSVMKGTAVLPIAKCVLWTFVIINEAETNGCSKLSTILGQCT